MLVRTIVVLSAMLATSPAPGQVCVGGDAPLRAHHQCVTPELAAHVRREVARNRQALGLAGRVAAPVPTGAGGPPVLFPFYPMAGNLGGDIFNGGFVDLDPSSPGYIDFECRPFTYDGHEGIDTGLRSFDEQFIGVPVYAALDGVVVFAQDGWPDTNTQGGVQGNIVIIDHGDAVETQYYHLKNGSVTVTEGQEVVAGRQIGQAASSGNSFGPHLHFQVLVDGGVYEPFAGACRSGPSGWSDQAPLDTEALYLDDFGITRTDLDTLDPPWWEPWALPTDSQFSTDDPAVYFWFVANNFPVDCPWRVRFFKPDDSLAWTAEWTWGNRELYRRQKSWFGFDFPAMGPVPGTWRIVFELDNQLMIDAPFEVVAGDVDPDFNRPPAPIGVAFDPPAPTIDDVLFCRVLTTTAEEDLDWDIVRYHYVWCVNDNVVRDVTTAAQSDALPRDTACGGSTVTCTVTPGDGQALGGAVEASIEVAGPNSPDINCDGMVGIDDLVAVITGWGPCPEPCPPTCPEDVDDDCDVDVDDLLEVILDWG